MDHFTVRSHTNAGKAHEEKWYDGEVMPWNGSTEENGIKVSTYEKVRGRGDEARSEAK
jgi:acetyl-CoA acyltransferase